jgi:hypothetical protein
VEILQYDATELWAVVLHTDGEMYAWFVSDDDIPGGKTLQMTVEERTQLRLEPMEEALTRIRFRGEDIDGFAVLDTANEGGNFVFSGMGFFFAPRPDGTGLIGFSRELRDINYKLLRGFPEVMNKVLNPMFSNAWIFFAGVGTLYSWGEEFANTVLPSAKNPMIWDDSMGGDYFTKTSDMNIKEIFATIECVFALTVGGEVHYLNVPSRELFDLGGKFVPFRPVSNSPMTGRFVTTINARGRSAFAAVSE